jgi:DNA polymerase I
MEIELHPAVSLLPETFNVLVSPVEMLVEALNSHLNLQRYKILYVCGNYSRILSRLDRNITEMEIQPSLHILPANDRPGGEPSQLLDH